MISERERAKMIIVTSAVAKLHSSHTFGDAARKHSVPFAEQVDRARHGQPDVSMVWHIAFMHCVDTRNLQQQRWRRIVNRLPHIFHTFAHEARMRDTSATYN